MKYGAATLGQLAEKAVARLVESGRLESANRLFTDEEREQLAKSLAATNGTAELLGRYRVRRRLEQARKFREGGGAEKFSDQPTDFSAFDDTLRPLVPQQALDFFLSLNPELGIDPRRWGPALERQAFTLAAATDKALLNAVKKALAGILETGQGAGRGKDVVQELLDRAGVSPNLPNYAEIVYRTNMMDAYTTGSTRELQDPDVAEEFPVWRYVGIRDGRQRASHEVHFDRYYPNEASFAEVRDSVDGEFSGFQCRCNFIPIDRDEWARLQRERGASVSTFSEEPPFDLDGAVREFARDLLGDESAKFCQEGENKGKPGPCPDGETESTPRPSLVSAIAGQAAKLPAAVWNKAKTTAQNVYNNAEAKYGPTYAKLIVGAFVAGLPLPGGTLLPAPIIAVAMLHKKLSAAKHDETASVTGVEQSQDHTCGPAALLSVCRRYGIDQTEESLAELLGTTEADGTDVEGMVAGAELIGLDAAGQEGMTLPALERAVILGRPVIVCMQALDEPADGWNGGHWAVVTGREGNDLLLNDPATGETVRLPRSDFLARWHDMDGGGRRWERFGLVVKGRSAEKFCQEGPNKGKPGPCPDPATEQPADSSGSSSKEFTGHQSSQAVSDWLSGKTQHELHAGLASSKRDTMLDAIMTEGGRGNPPKLADKAEIDSLAKKGWYICYRGVGQAEHAEQFRTGELYNGAGSYGNGSYFTYNTLLGGEKKAAAGAQMYAAQNSTDGKGAVIRAAFPPDAKFIDHATLKKEQNAFLKNLNDQFLSGAMTKDQYKKLYDLHEDAGRFAALRNYDAIRERTNGFLVILNRSKCIAQRGE